MTINRIQLIILSILSKANAKSPATSVSINYMMEAVPLGKSYSTIYREVNLLDNNNYISLGVKDGKFKTYYINENGNMALTTLLKEML